MSSKGQSGLLKPTLKFSVLAYLLKITMVQHVCCNTFQQYWSMPSKNFEVLLASKFYFSQVIYHCWSLEFILDSFKYNPQICNFLKSLSIYAVSANYT